MVHWCWTRSCTVVAVSLCHVFRESAEHDSGGHVTACLYHSEGVWTRVFTASLSQSFTVWLCGTIGPFMPQCLCKSSVMWWRSCQRCLVLMVLVFLCAVSVFSWRLLLTVELSAAGDYYGFMILTEQCVSIALNPRVYFSFMHNLWYTYRVRLYMYIYMYILYVHLTSVFFFIAVISWSR